MDTTRFARFADTIRNLPAASFSETAPIDSGLLMAKDNRVSVYYAPFDWVNPNAKVVLVGITPGRVQMLNALREAQRQLRLGASHQEALRAAKMTGAFSGSLRPNLVGLLDHIGLHRWLGVASCDTLFGTAAHLVQTTSALRYPVFVQGKNYNGTPNMLKTPLLRQQLQECFGQDARALPQAVFIPLGDAVAEALIHLADQGLLDRSRILAGLPHPSGANGERIAYFLGKKQRESLSQKTDPHKLDKARQTLHARVLALA
jgi:hypothetical protein